jgi:hypothetical protein
LRRYAPTFFFWDAVDRSPHPIAVLFAGTSRTAAAIDADVFRQLDSTAAGTTVNAGAGYVTPAEIYLAVRNALRERPGLLQGTVLFVEAPGGMADPQHWSDRWSHPDRPDVLNPLLRRDDLVDYWRGHRLAESVDLSVRYLTRSSDAITQHEVIGAKLFARAQELVQAPLDALLPRRPAAAPAADLTSAGGIRTDAEGVLVARRLAEASVTEERQHQQPIDWNGSVVAGLLDFCAAHRLRVVFFAPPLHSLPRSVYETPQRRADREHFANLASARGVPILVPDFPTRDEDFPDIWHLQKSSAPGYTRALFDSYARLRAGTVADGRVQ